MRHMQHRKRSCSPHYGKLLSDGVNRNIHNSQADAKRLQRRLVLGKRDAVQFKFFTATEFFQQVQGVGPNSAVDPPGIDAKRSHGACIALIRTSWNPLTKASSENLRA